MTNSFDSLKDEYTALWTKLDIRQERLAEIQHIFSKVTNPANKLRYQNVETATGVPWHVIAAIHNLESSRRFDRHLHNGDPLTARTVHEPSGLLYAGRAALHLGAERDRRARQADRHLAVDDRAHCVRAREIQWARLSQPSFAREDSVSVELQQHLHLREIRGRRTLVGIRGQRSMRRHGSAAIYDRPGRNHRAERGQSAATGNLAATAQRAALPGTLSAEPARRRPERRGRAGAAEGASHRPRHDRRRFRRSDRAGRAPVSGALWPTRPANRWRSMALSGRRPGARCSRQA